MKTRTVLSAALFSAALIGSVPSAMARAYVDIEIAPPAPRVEVVPAPRAGYEWAPGYWNWNGHHHVWVGGHYIHARAGYHWVAHRWDARGGRYHMEEGHWERR